MAKYIVILGFIMFAYLQGRIHSYKEIVKCSDETASQLKAKHVLDFYGHKTYDYNHHLAFSYYKAMDCLLRRK